MLPCLFCESVLGDLPQAVIHEGPDVVAFLDWRQSAPGHVLVLPRQHLSAEELFAGPVGAQLMAVAVRVAAAVRAALRVDGVQLGGVVHPGAGQARVSGRVRAAHPEEAVQTAEDGHFHLHILPRFSGGVLARIYTYGDDVADPAQIASIATALRAALAGEAVAGAGGGGPSVGTRDGGRPQRS